MKTFILLMATGLSLFATPRAPVVALATAKEVVFWYGRPDTSTCTWSMSTSSSYSPLVTDVSGNQTDSGVSGERWYVVGATTALTASTTYYWRQVCGSETYTGTVVTPVASPVPIGGPNLPWAISGGTPLGANSMYVETGATPALGTTATLVCSLSCTASGTKLIDTALFYRYTWQNSGTALLSTTSIKVLR